jgi:hypothetical protein
MILNFSQAIYVNLIRSLLLRTKPNYFLQLIYVKSSLRQSYLLSPQ